MRRAAAFGLLAMVPAAVNATAPASLTITASTCAGASHAITVPLRGGEPAKENGQPCCAKGCHSGNSRKRFHRAC